MNFVLDASVTMAWLFGDAKPSDRLYAQKVLNALKDPDTRVAVPTTWALEVANVIARAADKRRSPRVSQERSTWLPLGKQAENPCGPSGSDHRHYPRTAVTMASRAAWLARHRCPLSRVPRLKSQMRQINRRCVGCQTGGVSSRRRSSVIRIAFARPEGRPRPYQTR